jgi:hypothetical protein
MGRVTTANDGSTDEGSRTGEDRPQRGVLRGQVTHGRDSGSLSSPTTESNTT